MEHNMELESCVNCVEVVVWIEKGWNKEQKSWMQMSSGNTYYNRGWEKLQRLLIIIVCCTQVHMAFLSDGSRCLNYRVGLEIKMSSGNSHPLLNFFFFFLYLWYWRQVFRMYDASGENNLGDWVLSKDCPPCMIYLFPCICSRSTLVILSEASCRSSVQK